MSGNWIERVRAAKAGIEEAFDSADRIYQAILDSSASDAVKQAVKGLKSENTQLKNSFRTDQLETAYDHAVWSRAVVEIQFINKGYSELINNNTSLDKRKQLADDFIERFGQIRTRFTAASEDFAHFPSKVKVYVERAVQVLSRYGLDSDATKITGSFILVPTNILAFTALFTFYGLEYVDIFVSKLNNAKEQSSNAVFNEYIAEAGRLARAFDESLKRFIAVVRPE